MVSSKRKKAEHEPMVARSGPEILRDIDQELLSIDGKPMSKREAQLRLLYARALKGDSRASVELHLVRDKCGVEKDTRKTGCLLLPAPISNDKWERLAYEQQRPFREGPYPTVEA